MKKASRRERREGKRMIGKNERWKKGRKKGKEGKQAIKGEKGRRKEEGV